MFALQSSIFTISVQIHQWQTLNTHNPDPNQTQIPPFNTFRNPPKNAKHVVLPSVILQGGQVRGCHGYTPEAHAHRCQVRCSLDRERTNRMMGGSCGSGNDRKKTPQYSILRPTLSANKNTCAWF